MLPGQFWAISLSNGTYAAGRVIQLDPSHNRAFLCGLMDWNGPNLPTAEDLAGRKTLDQGHVHIKTIQGTGGSILGHRPLELDGIEPQMFVPQEGWKHGVTWLMKGLTELRPATKEEWASLHSLATWGYRSIEGKAEAYFIEGRIPKSFLPPNR